MDRTAPSCQKHWNADSVVFIRLYLDWVFFFFFCFLSPPSSTLFFIPLRPYSSSSLWQDELLRKKIQFLACDSSKASQILYRHPLPQHPHQGSSLLLRLLRLLRLLLSVESRRTTSVRTPSSGFAAEVFSMTVSTRTTALRRSLLTRKVSTSEKLRAVFLAAPNRSPFLPLP